MCGCLKWIKNYKFDIRWHVNIIKVILITIKNFILKKDHTNRICKYYFIKIKRGYKMCSYCPSLSYIWDKS